MTQGMPGEYLRPSFSATTVADATNPGILACPADAPLRTVAKVMVAQGVHCVAVTGTAEADGEPPVLGIVSDLELVRRALTDGFDLPAAELAAAPAVTVEASTSLREAGELMIEHGVQHLVVIEPGTTRPVGVLSSLDLAAAIAWGGE